MNAVNAYADRTGALLLAEGIEDEAHLRDRPRARRPPRPGVDVRPSGRAVADRHAHRGRVLRRAPSSTPQSSPFGCLPAGTALRRSTKPLLVELSKHLEREALAHGSTGVVVSTFQFAEHFTPKTAQRYRELADRLGFVAAIGEGLPAEPVPGVRGADLSTPTTRCVTSGT